MGSRRDFVRGLIACAAALPLACKRQPERKRSQKMVIFFLSGGPDGVLTLDPKTPGEIDTWVDNPMRDQNVESGNIRLGALWAPLAKFSSKMAIVHGVRVESANHFAGTWQFLRMRRRGLMNTPGILDLFARHRDAPLGAITVGTLFNRTYTPSWVPLDGTVVPQREREGLAKYDDLPPDQLRELASVMREMAETPSLRPPDRESYERVAAYLDAVQTAPKFAPEDWKAPESFAVPIQGMQRVLWAFEHDLASAALVYFGFNSFDSHFANIRRQKDCNGAFVASFEKFLDALSKRRNKHGTLAEQTTIVAAGELGRYPRVNSDAGKDHYPEISMLFMGAGVNTGGRGAVLGHTGKDMLGLPMDLATGKVGTGTRHLFLDDVGTTLLSIAGIEPTQFGYPAHPIEPLIA